MYEASDDPPSKATRAAPKPRPARLLIVTPQRLLRDAFVALAKQDGQFQCLAVRLGSPACRESPEPPEPAVALIDSASDEKLIHRAYASHTLVGGVLLTDLPTAGGDADLNAGPVRLGNVELVVLGLDTAWEDLAAALATAWRGGRVDAAHRPADAPHGAALGRTIGDDLRQYRSLSRREREVLAGIGAGLSPSEVAAKLHIAVSTAENHKSRLMKKTNIHRTAELVRFAIRVGAAPL